MKGKKETRRLNISHCTASDGQISHRSETVLLLQVSITTQIKLWTDKDPLLLKVRNFVSNSWPYSVSEKIQPYFPRRSELTLLDGCLMWGSRVIVAAAGHSATL